MASGLLLLQSESNTAQVTSFGNRCSEGEKSSAFRRLGCARLRPANTRLHPTLCSEHHSAVPSEQHLHELLAESNEKRFDTTHSCVPQRHTTVSGPLYSKQTSVDRVANVSVHFPNPSSADGLTRRLRAIQRTARRNLRTLKMTTFAPTPHLQSLRDYDCDRMHSSFDVLPDAVVRRVFASGLDSCELCRCSTVCRRWNNLIWSDRRLWTTIDLRGRCTLDIDLALHSVMCAISGRATARLRCAVVDTLLLGGCWRLTDNGLFAVATRCAVLRRLDVSSCPLITDTGLFHVLSRCVNLQHLHINGISCSLCLEIHCVQV